MNKEEIKAKFDEIINDKKLLMNIACVAVGVICIVVAGFGLYGVYKDYKVGDDIYTEVESEFVQIHIPTEEPSDDTDTEEQKEVGYKGPWYERATVDVAGLKAQYPDVVGWLLFEDCKISYPIMHSDSNDTYLYTTYNGVESIAGSIFVEATHSGDFSDTHTLIYGHNMKNGSMFGRLHYYRRSNDYYEEDWSRQYFQVFTEKEILRYKIFAYQEVSVESFVFKEFFTSGTELGNRLLENSRIKPDVTIPEDGKIITLSTCTAKDTDRFVVSAVLVERYSLEEKALIEE